MQPLGTLIQIEKNDKLPVYLQIANQLITLINTGILQAGFKLLSSRELSAVIGVNRVTVVKAYEELLVQGWLQSFPGKGTFVAANLPDLNRLRIPEINVVRINPLKNAGFSFDDTPHLERPVLTAYDGLHLDDGFPDARLAPLQELSRAYRTQLLTGNPYTKLGYSYTKGSLKLREQLSAYLNDTRGLKTTAENILITRGTMMGFYLVTTCLIKPGDHVIVGNTGWIGEDLGLQHAGAKVFKVEVDEFGIDVEGIETICKQHTIRMVSVTSHHHYPTTVTLWADRRLKLLQLAEEYGFIIFEDDYDYEFHFSNKPLLPLAGADREGMVLYAGSFSKTISPAFRVGYLTGPENVITHLAQHRRIIDRQGDLVLENAMAEMLEYGFIQRHLRKSMKIYKQRRDVFCELMQDQLKGVVSFTIPDGGMALWTKFDRSVDMSGLAERALQRGLYFSNGKSFGQDNYTRLGYASSTPVELEQCVEIIKKLL